MCKTAAEYKYAIGELVLMLVAKACKLKKIYDGGTNTEVFFRHRCRTLK